MWNQLNWMKNRENRNAKHVGKSTVNLWTETVVTIVTKLLSNAHATREWHYFGAHNIDNGTH